jgi:superfamily II DNA or RNA helicase
MKAKKGINPLRDYGLDGIYTMTVDGRQIYGGLQMKYFTNFRVTANHIGTFFNIQNRMRLKYPESQGYLYSTTPLEPELKDSCKDPNFIIQHRLYAWTPNDSSIFHTEKTVCETDLSLRPYQIDCLNTLNRHIRNIIFIPCGLGKSLIAGHHLKSKQYPFILAIAPLKISVQNLQTRLTPFISDYQTLLVDSDIDGTTDIEEIEKFIQGSNSKKILFSTYKSTLNILMNILDPIRVFILVDEVHNATSEICEYMGQFQESLGMTATLPDEVRESLPEDTQIFKVSLSDAIRNGYLVDYTVWFPEQTSEIFDSILDAKAFYLANSMLKTGSRRCIAYLSNIQECSDFQVFFNRVMRDFHGINVWTAQIDCSVPAQKRTEILEEFQNSDFAVLMSVRILDEAVDIPRCDSEFIGQIGESSSDIRMIQRWGRGSRLDSQNPTKHNNIFIWSLDWDECVNVLSRLMEVDPEFHKKIKFVAAKYDTQHTIDVQERIIAREQEFRDWSNIHCITYDEKRMRKLNELKEEANRLERVPKQKERGGKFWDNMKQGHNNDLLPLALENRYLRVDYEIYNYKLSSNEKIQELNEEANRLERVPKRNERGGEFWYSMKQGRNKVLLPLALQNRYLREDYELFQRKKEERCQQGSRPLPPQERLQELITETNRLERVPKIKEVGGKFWDQMKQGRNKVLLPLALENRYLREDYERYQRDKQKREQQERLLSFEKTQELIKDANRLGRVPTRKEKYGEFWKYIKQGRNKYLLQMALENPYLRVDYEKYQQKKEKRLTNPQQPSDKTSTH